VHVQRASGGNDEVCEYGLAAATAHARPFLHYLSIHSFYQALSLYDRQYCSCTAVSFGLELLCAAAYVAGSGCLAFPFCVSPGQLLYIAAGRMYMSGAGDRSA
jgi:hypothetical protein